MSLFDKFVDEAKDALDFSNNPTLPYEAIVRVAFKFFEKTKENEIALCEKSKDNEIALCMNKNDILKDATIAYYTKKLSSISQRPVFFLLMLF